MPVRTKTTGRVLDVASQVGGASPGTTTLDDKSRWGNDGTMTAVTWTQLPSGLWVMVLNGTTSASDSGMPASLDMTADISLEAWFNTDTVAGDDYIVNMTGKLILYRSTSRFACVHTHDVVGAKYTYTAVSIVSAGVWYHGVFTYTTAETVGRLYLNGAEITYDVQQATGNNLLSVLSGNVTIAAGGAVGFSGNMVLVRIYNYNVSPAQVRARYAATRGLFGV